MLSGAAVRCACGGGCSGCNGSLKIGSAHDSLKHEADRVAYDVMTGSASRRVHRASELIQRGPHAHGKGRRFGAEQRVARDLVYWQTDASCSPAGHVRELGSDFSHLKLHTGGEA